MVLPDAVGGHFGVVDDTVVVLHKAGDGRALGAVEMEVPQWLADACQASGASENGYWRTQVDTSRTYYVPCAATLEGRLYAFMLSNPRLASPPRGDKPALYRLTGPFVPARDGLDRLAPVDLEEKGPVTGMSVSEDGLRLLLAQEKADRLSILDVKTCQPVAALTIPAPAGPAPGTASPSRCAPIRPGCSSPTPGSRWSTRSTPGGLPGTAPTPT
jgi:hypothetical protein